MKQFNVVMSILILVLAIVAAVFAYFLFEKREQITDWGNKMGDSIRSASATLDKDSGTMVAQKLDKESLSHREYENISSKLNEFNKQIKAVEVQRDELADALVAVIRATGNQEGELYSAANFKDIEIYETVKDQPRKVAQEVKNQADTMAARTVAIARVLEYPTKLTADKEFFSGSNGEAAYKGLEKQAEKWVDETETLRDGVNEIFDSLGKDGNRIGRELVDAESSKAAVEVVKDRARKVVAERDQFSSDLKKAEATIKVQDTKIADLEMNVSELNIELAAKEDEILKLNAVINGDNGRLDTKEWAPGSIASRRAMRGEVIDINNKFGIVTVDLGKNTRVRQLVGNMWTDVDPLVEQLDKENLKLVVMRSNSKGNAELVAQIRLVRVDDACSIAEVVRTDASKSIKVGDFVVIAEEDLVDAAE